VAARKIIEQRDKDVVGKRTLFLNVEALSTLLARAVALTWDFP
jgi:hypothetical protein